METKVLHVKGMSCEHCVHTIRSALKSLGGVSDVQVDLQKGEVTVAFDGGMVGESEFRQAIEDAGYELTGISAR